MIQKENPTFIFGQKVDAIDGELRSKLDTLVKVKAHLRLENVITLDQNCM
jgi:hypothetical protein